MSIEKLKKFWDTCDESFSHTQKDPNKLITSWERQFLSRLNFQDKIVLDYGIGAAYLGDFLLKNKRISHYYGIDISDRSLKKANKLLKDQTNYNLYNTSFFYKEFNYKVDIIIAQQVIQHFIDKITLDSFLEKINDLSPQHIMLQTILPVSSKEVEFIDFNPYKNQSKDVQRACRVNSTYILNQLPKYKISSLYTENAVFNDKSNFIIYSKINSL